MITVSDPLAGIRPSVFAGTAICEEVGLRLRPGTCGPVFEQDRWDFRNVEGLPRSLRDVRKIIDFAKIRNPLWRPVVKEYVLALMAPLHEKVRDLPGAYRIQRTLQTTSNRGEHTVAWLNWLTAQGVTSLTEVDQYLCDAYLIHRSTRRTRTGVTVETSESQRLMAVLVPQEFAAYSELFTHDRLPDGLRPWNGASALSVIGATKQAGNKTQPARAELLQPLLQGCLFLLRTIAPPALELRSHIRETHATTVLRSNRATGERRKSLVEEVIRRHMIKLDPLEGSNDLALSGKHKAGWTPEDPLWSVNLTALAREAGLKGTILPGQRRGTPQDRTAEGGLLGSLRPLLEEAVAIVGTAPRWARRAPDVTRADGHGKAPWTLPLHERDLIAVLDAVRTAALIVIALLSGMRQSELIELPIDCRLPAEGPPGRQRYRLKSKLIKGQGYDTAVWDEWVVVKEAYEAAGVAAAIAGEDATHLFSRTLDFDECLKRLRRWVNGPHGQRLHLAPIPGDNLTLRTFRRTLALEIAHRPGGLLAAKVQLKHLSVVTTEGYAHRPGGAQAKFLAEIGREEYSRNEALTLQAFRDYQDGKRPAGPGGRDLIRFFETVESQLAVPAAAAPNVKPSDQEVITLLAKRAGTLHLGLANYCWFIDPAKALCLKLAGTPDRKTPLAGMCDSARCPQATHHAGHRGVWASAAGNYRVFIGKIGRGQKSERARLASEIERADRVVAEIDAATPTEATP
ncbi:site-specific integrase [Streptomyces violascens]|uniref:site-specific integrase n=1 Tax=Streptomyces violascens TaxID=67381 RepID=UPI003664D62F